MERIKEGAVGAGGGKVGNKIPLLGVLWKCYNKPNLRRRARARKKNVEWSECNNLIVSRRRKFVQPTEPLKKVVKSGQLGKGEAFCENVWQRKMRRQLVAGEEKKAWTKILARY